MKGCTYNITNISAANYPRVDLDKVLLPYAQIFQSLSALEYQTCFLINAKAQHVYQMIQYTNNLILFFINIDENMRN